MRWNITTSDDGQYLYIKHEGKPGQVHIKRDDEGFVVDIFTDEKDPTCVASTYALFSELNE